MKGGPYEREEGTGRQEPYAGRTGAAHMGSGVCRTQREAGSAAGRDAPEGGKDKRARACYPAEAPRGGIRPRLHRPRFAGDLHREPVRPLQIPHRSQPRMGAGGHLCGKRRQRHEGGHETGAAKAHAGLRSRGFGCDRHEVHQPVRPQHLGVPGNGKEADEPRHTADL